jgi:hypothetical protein
VSIVIGMFFSDMWLVGGSALTARECIDFFCFYVVIIFFLFLNNNIFSLDLLLTTIYEVNFLRFYFYESLKITKSVYG